MPSANECIDIAKDWLESHGLYPENVISISTSPFIIYVSQGNDFYKFTRDISVSFTIGINGYEIQGVGAYVAIGENGEIIAAYINTPELKKYTTVSLHQPETIIQTFADYLDNLELFYSDAPLCLVNSISQNMSVMNIKLKYFSMLSEDNYITALAQPVLVLEGQENISDSLNSGAFIARIDAVKRN